MVKKTLAESLRNKEYYQIAHSGSDDLSHPAMKLISMYIKNAKSVLDMGCGEGNRLSLLVKGYQNSIEAYGVDNNTYAINLAKKQFPNIRFLKNDLVKLPFGNNSFDLIYSAYVFEHLMDPEKVLRESFRILKGTGVLIIVAPNFGSPNRRSPNSVENKFGKLFKGFINDFKLLFVSKMSGLNWKKVTPSSDKYSIDTDTTIEPYLLKLIKYGKFLGFKIVFSSTYWNQDRISLFQLTFRIMGYLNIYPFKYWGPHLCVVFKKNE